LAILADGAERGVVVQNGKIVELVAEGRAQADDLRRVLRGRRSCRAARADQTPIIISTKR